jgi:hypothetical protein
MNKVHGYNKDGTLPSPKRKRDMEQSDIRGFKMGRVQGDA